MKFSSTLEESGGRARRTVGVTEGGSPRSEKKFGGFLDVGGWARRLGEEFGGEDAAGRSGILQSSRIEQVKRPRVPARLRTFIFRCERVCASSVKV